MARPPSAFISHAREDGPIVERLSLDLEKRGFKVFRAYSDISPGESWAARLQKEISGSDLVFIVASKASEKSELVSSETALALAEAQSGRTVVIPVIAERNAELPYFLRRVHALDYTEPRAPQTQKALDSLVNRIDRSGPDRASFDEDESNAQVEALRSSKKSLELEKAIFVERRAASSYVLSTAVASLTAVLGLVAGILSLSDIKSFVGSNLQFILGAFFGIVGSAVSVWVIARIRSRSNNEERD